MSPGDLLLYVRGNACTPAKYTGRHGSWHLLEAGGAIVYARSAEVRPGPVNPELFARLFKRIKVDANGCWIWQLSLRTDGYGQVSTKRGKAPVGAHRAMWFAMYGEMPGKADGHYVCHACDVKPCCNPAHLWKGTPAQNNLDRDLKGRNPQKSMTQCKRGHAFTPENTISPRPGQRACRKCQNMHQRLLRERRRIQEGRAKRSPFTTTTIRAAIVELVKKGLSYSRVATRLSINKSQVYNCMRSQPEQKPENRLMCRNGLHRMTDSNVRVEERNGKSWRTCRACDRAADDRFNESRRKRRAQTVSPESSR